ncbi:hypothetical protein DFH27DRAFT_529374 [Peziza echinospora]|nr:hypothetical protein DFH27DRAFT_529374 [Peziza echinospora]
MGPNRNGRTCWSASSARSTTNMELLELFLEAFNMSQDFNLNIGAGVHNISPNRNGRTCWSASSAWSTTNMELLELFLEAFNITHDKHSKVTLSEWNIGLLDGLNRLHQVPGLQLEYWWSCAQHGSKPQWSHMLECKQRTVNHEHGVVRVVPGGIQHVRLIAGGCRALASLSDKFHATSSNLTVLRHSDNYQHSNPQARRTSTPKSQDFNLNIGAGVHNISPKRNGRTCWSASSAWSTTNMELLELFLEAFNMSQDFNLNIGGVVHNMGPNRNGRTCWSASSAWSTTNMELLELFLEAFNMSQDFNLNIGGVVHNMGPNRNGRTCWSASSAWSTTNVELLELFLEEFNMFVRLQVVAEL